MTNKANFIIKSITKKVVWIHEKEYKELGLLNSTIDGLFNENTH
jgi:hypothetical protein